MGYYDYYNRTTTYRTKTYIAGEWDGDSNAIQKLYEWKENRWLDFDFVDAHDLTQARDTSLNCSIKQSLKTRLDVSKTFVLVVGKNTINVRAGSCVYCGSYNSWGSYCARGHSVDYRSFIEYECEKAKEAGIKIVVLYNDTVVNKNKCPEVIRYTGTHVPMLYYDSTDGKYKWDFYTIKNAIGA